MFTAGIRVAAKASITPLSFRTRPFSTTTSRLYAMATQSDKPVVLYTFGTANGFTASIYLEELKAAYGVEYEFVSCLPVALHFTDLRSCRAVRTSISDADAGKVHNHVKQPWYIEQINPNGRIPAITHNGLRIFETSAILNYLSQVFDKDRKFSKDPVTDIKAWVEEQSWLFYVVRYCFATSCQFFLTLVSLISTVV